MTIEQLAFYVISATALLSALLVVSLKNFVRSIFLFFLTLFSMAGLFVFALADFVAVTQLVIYVGGVLVLMIFAFLLSNRELLNNPEASEQSGFLHYLPGITVSVVFLGVLLMVLLKLDPGEFQWIQQSKENTLKPTDNTIHYLGINIMTRYLLPFEVVSVLLLMALIGAAHLARKEKEQ
ncbi:NADH-quinone oxidoreductase subunit J [Paradesertivirga mongoliensis]|uniref:NADH-quinone oxidoreductase subunit J n=1 Tax=Paradesertivirga mongoliensis TaxID=2100740 RepID=A0ABW4ZSD9_9SPHI|nr:NADH-quinone oxidoreductase subunit J [Pedobacter mongoliensis]